MLSCTQPLPPLKSSPFLFRFPGSPAAPGSPCAARVFSGLHVSPTTCSHLSSQAAAFWMCLPQSQANLSELDHLSKHQVHQAQGLCSPPAVLTNSVSQNGLSTRSLLTTWPALPASPGTLGRLRHIESIHQRPPQALHRVLPPNSLLPLQQLLQLAMTTLVGDWRS